jgi:histidyl-tRNA synthetase
MNIQTLKGFRDFLPEQAKKRQYVTGKLRRVFEKYGFEPLETPALEYEEILTGKYGEEGDKLMYRFEDNGGRKVAMRYDQTVPLARVVAQYQNQLPFPFKRYQIQPVWRADNTQKGRFREFLQCDIDTVGTSSPAADAEIVAAVNESFKALGFTNYQLLINDRSLFGKLPAKAIQIIDKLEKQGMEEVAKQLRDAGFDQNILNELQNKKPTDTLNLIMESARDMDVPEDKLAFSPTLARGLDYYTGMILEVTIGEYSVGSVAGGGRYDNLIGMFTKRQIPAVGLAFGFDRIMEAMEEQNLFPDTLPGGTKTLVTIFNLELADTSTKLANQLRSSGINAELWLDGTSKMEKQLKYADQKNIPFVIIVGPEEKEKNLVTLKNMKTREQKQLTLSEVVSMLSSS